MQQYKSVDWSIVAFCAGFDLWNPDDAVSAVKDLSDTTHWPHQRGDVVLFDNNNVSNGDLS